MIIWVDDLIFSGTVRNIDLIALLRNAATRRHTIIISDDIVRYRHERKRDHYEKWLANLPETISRELLLLSERFDLISSNSLSYGESIRLIISHRKPHIKPPHVCQLGVADAIRALSLPLYIMVENQINDGAFLRKIIPPIWGDRITAWEKTGELRFIQGGGNTEIARIIEYHNDNNQCRLAFGLPTQIWNLSHFIVYDHDGTSKDSPGQGAAKLDVLCQHVRGHRLFRRTQEHYLPPEVLAEIIDNRITDPTQRSLMHQSLIDHCAKGDQRHFEPLPKIGDSPFFKNEFTKNPHWSYELAEKDGVTMEMTSLAESIASAI